MKTFFSNTYLFDKFLGNELMTNEDKEISNWESVMLANMLVYSKNEAEFADFGEWLEKLRNSDKFIAFTNEL